MYSDCTYSMKLRWKIFAAAIAVSALADPVLAADLPSTKGPPAFVPPPPAVTWTGCSAGVNIGYGWQRNHAYDPNVPGDTGADTGNGVVGGGQLGCDYQSGAFVFGVQGRFDGTSVSGRHIDPPPVGSSPSDTLATTTQWVATQTGRIGYTILPQALAYVKGGVAEARIHYTDIDTTIPYWGSASPTRVGWTVGAGAEYALTPNWSVFAEYDYTDFGTRTVTLAYTSPVPAFAAPYAFRETNSLQTVLVGANYRFDLFAGQAPVAAKY